MWKRRTSEEIEAIERQKRRSQSRFNPTKPLVIALGLSVFVVITSWAGWRGKFIPWGDPIAFMDALLNLPRAFALGFLVCYGIRLLRPFMNNGQQRTVICNRCHEVQAMADDSSCPCGGQREPFEHWRWLRDDMRYDLV